MRRLLAIVLLAVLLLVLPVLADNAKRIAEIEDAQKQIIVDVQQLQAQRSQIDAAIADKNTEFAKLQGAKEELQRQDAETKKSPKKEG